MRYKLEKLGCYILILILLPYIVTVFLNGSVITLSSNVEEMTVTVQEGQEQMSVPLDEYGIGILAREISADYELEAVKAQAILVRTRLYKTLEEKGSDTIFTEEFWTRKEMEEVWGIATFTRNYNKFENAWNDTEGQVLMYEGKLVYTPFFYLSNGNTRDGKEVLGKEYPYLKIKDCPLDIEATEQIQTTTIEVAEQGHTTTLEGENAKITDIEVVSCDTAGYVLKVRVGKEEVSGEEFRTNYNLASSCFSVHEYEGQLRITTRGVGHGIGLSQYTANQMAENEETTEDILKYFFEGCEIQEVADFVRNPETSDKKE